MRKFWKNWSHRNVLIAVYSAAALLVSVQRLSLGKLEKGQTAYENYLIFKNALANMISGVNPYGYFDSMQWDQYKYSPAFAFFMAPFSAMPDAIGLPFWNLLNALTLLFALFALPLARKHLFFIAWLILPELLISMQNSQSNGLTAALILLSWIGLERGESLKAGFGIAAGTFLKIFGGLAAFPALLYRSWFRSWVWALILSVLFFFLPLIFLAPDRFIQLYEWWFELLREDHQDSIGLSVSGWLESWFAYTPDRAKLLLAGFFIFLGSMATAYVLGDPESRKTRILSWASLLIWVIIFNHKAESPTFVIAMCGVGLWYWAEPERPFWQKLLLGLAFILVSFSSSDLFPRYLRKSFFEPYVIKSVPCIAVWILIQIELVIQGIKTRPAHGD